MAETSDTDNARNQFAMHHPDKLRIAGGRSAAVTLCLTVLLSFTAQAADAPAAVGPHDGAHDFDWEFGSWDTHLKVLRHKDNGDEEWADYQGISVVSPIWNGRGNIVQLEADGPGGHVEALNLRLYNPQSHQWSLNFANAKAGVIGVPTVGEFKDGVGRFYDQEVLDGRTVLVRNLWSRVSHEHAHLEQAISQDGGTTWDTNWIADLRRQENAGVQSQYE
jgi:hypothetical protein